MGTVIRTARVFRNGRNQAVRIPREFEFVGREVVIRRQGDSLILSGRPGDWSGLTGSGAGSGAGSGLGSGLGFGAVATGAFLRWLELPGENA